MPWWGWDECCITWLIIKSFFNILASVTFMCVNSSYKSKKRENNFPSFEKTTKYIIINNVKMTKDALFLIQLCVNMGSKHRLLHTCICWGIQNRWWCENYSHAWIFNCVTNTKTENELPNTDNTALIYITTQMRVYEEIR